MGWKRRGVIWTWRRLVLVVATTLVLIVGGALAGCSCSSCVGGEVPEFSPDQVEAATIERPPGTLWTSIDLAEPETKEKLLAAYEHLYPWGDEQGRVSPDLELRLQLSDGRTIGVAAMKGSPEMLVRVYKDGELTSELHAGGQQMYDLFYPDSPLPQL